MSAGDSDKAMGINARFHTCRHKQCTFTVVALYYACTTYCRCCRHAYQIVYTRRSSTQRGNVQRQRTYKYDQKCIGSDRLRFLFTFWWNINRRFQAFQRLVQTADKTVLRVLTCTCTLCVYEFVIRCRLQYKPQTATPAGSSVVW